MLNVRYKSPTGEVQTTQWPDSYIVKVLQSGVMQIRRPVIADVPPMGSDDEEMTVAKELTVAVYSCQTEFVVWRSHDENV